MAINFITILFFLPLLAINVNAQGPVTYDIPKYGAKSGADISKRTLSIKINNVSIKNVRGMTNSAEVVTLICSSLKPCENVEVGDINFAYNGNQGPITTKCSNVKSKFIGKQNPPVCATTAKST
ncbi:UNVERIFIED_CONTAM: Polygalacturonase [Sesamum angustifolium]|uniref:Polygalacturonase n=1 Tax=Sesamum angustifolium TaxID=2727405 RepID=A0AAW2IYH9_9LAMI